MPMWVIIITVKRIKQSYTERRGHQKLMATQRKYVKVGIPIADISVMRWLENQDNMSDSIRSLIRDDVERNGYSDVFCREVVPGAKKGRPSNAELQMRAEQKSGAFVESKGQVVQDMSRTQNTSQGGQAHRAVTPVKKPSTKSLSDMGIGDDDGFVDPEKLLGF